MPPDDSRRSQIAATLNLYLDTIVRVDLAMQHGPTPMPAYEKLLEEKTQARVALTQGCLRLGYSHPETDNIVSTALVLRDLRLRVH